MNIKKKSSHQERSSWRSTASRAERFLVGVGDLADGELDRRLLQRLSGGVDRQVVRRPRCTELPRRFEPFRRSEPPSRYEPSRTCSSEPAASASSPVSVVPRPGVVSESPDGRRSALTVVVGARSVTRPLTGDNYAVQSHCRELRRLSRCLPITARGRHV